MLGKISMFDVVRKEIVKKLNGAEGRSYSKQAGLPGKPMAPSW
jgi:hypothetical protein